MRILLCIVVSYRAEYDGRVDPRVGSGPRSSSKDQKLLITFYIVYYIKYVSRSSK